MAALDDRSRGREVGIGLSSRSRNSVNNSGFEGRRSGKGKWNVCIIVVVGDDGGRGRVGGISMARCGGRNDRRWNDRRRNGKRIRIRILMAIAVGRLCVGFGSGFGSGGIRSDGSGFV